MRFPHVRRFRRTAPANESDDGLAASRAWRDSGLVDAVDAFLGGRLVSDLTAAGQSIPVWAVLNRLAHGDRSDVTRSVEGTNPDRIAHPSSGQPSWAPAERLVGGHLLARASTPDDLWCL